MFVGNRLIEAGRAELVGQYEGQTVARTRAFLLNNLDRGVIFVDEAYAITPWQNGSPESYGSEATTAMVEFMTRYAGLYCIIVAGYETEMVRYFLPTNDGLARRFPNKFVLNHMSAEDLVLVFKRTLLLVQGLDVPDGRSAPLDSDAYFDDDAWGYLRDLVHLCTQGEHLHREEYDDATRTTYARVRTFVPTFEHLYRLFENQAGSMTNLADEGITVLMKTVSYQEVVASRRAGGRLIPTPQPRRVMRDIVVQRIFNSALTDTQAYLRQLAQVDSML